MTSWSMFSMVLSVLFLTACRDYCTDVGAVCRVKEARRVADEVTAAYGVQDVKILVYEYDSLEPRNQTSESTTPEGNPHL
jgi:hypothetical protein